MAQQINTIVARKCQKSSLLVYFCRWLDFFTSDHWPPLSFSTYTILVLKLETVNWTSSSSPSIWSFASFWASFPFCPKFKSTSLNPACCNRVALPCTFFILRGLLCPMARIKSANPISIPFSITQQRQLLHHHLLETLPKLENLILKVLLVSPNYFFIVKQFFFKCVSIKLVQYVFRFGHFHIVRPLLINSDCFKFASC